MPEIVYVGPFGSVDVPHLRLRGAAYGTPVEVTDDAAKSLLEQPDNWAAAGSPEAKAAAAAVAERAKQRTAAEKAAKAPKNTDEAKEG